SSNASGSGIVSTCAAGKVMNSEHVPSGRFHWPFQTQTLRPMQLTGTPDPTFSITPAPSLWGMTREASIGRDPLRALTSDGLTPEVLTAMRTSPHPGSAAGISPTTSTSLAAPVLSYQAARIVHRLRFRFATPQANKSRSQSKHYAPLTTCFW